MATEREKRIALNEAAFRVANERMRGWDERRSATEPQDYICECSNPDCRERVLLTRDEYEAVRRDSRRFVIVPGHEIPEAEEVVERHAGHAVIQKPPSARAIAERTDPRRD